MMDEMVAWLRDQMDSTEFWARQIQRQAQDNDLAVKDPRLLGRVVPGWSMWPDVETMCELILADVAAKRAIVDLHELEESADWRYYQRGEWARAEVPKRLGCVICDGSDSSVWPNGADGCTTLRLLAEAFAARPGYREEWRPARTTTP